METVRRHLKRIVPTLLLVVGVVVAFMVFIQDNTARIDRQNEEYLAELTEQRAASVDTLISENLTFINTTAYLFGKDYSVKDADEGVIKDFEGNSAFEMLRFVDAHGRDHTSEGVKANLSNRAYFQAGMRGESGVTYVLKSKVTGQKQLGFYAPVRNGDAVVGVMVGFYGEEFIGTLLAYGLFGSEGEGWLCDSDGTVIGSTLEDEPDDFLAFLGDGRCNESELRDVGKAFTAGRDIAFSYTEGGERSSAYAAALSGTDWMLVRNFPAPASEMILDSANREGVMLIAELVVLFLAYVVFIAVGFVIDQRRMRESNRNANDISAGVSTLFEKFVTVDFGNGGYRYIGGRPASPDLPTEGPYPQFAQSLLARIPEPEHRAEVEGVISLDNLARALRGAESLSLRVHAPTAAAEWLTYNFIVIERGEDNAPSRLLAVCQDVTELHEREQEEQDRLQRALGAAERASHAKTEFLFNMSHDLRTPMNAIIGYTELAQREGVTEDEMRAYVRKIDASSLHLLSLINDILEMSRIESGKITLEPAPCDIVRVMDEARSMFATQMAGKELAFSVDASGVRDRWVLCDANRLDRVVLNLVSNAYKFTPEGGQVRVSLGQDGPARDGTASYVLRVADTGIGMSKDFVERIFSPFERERTSTVSRTQGTGLGLSITKNIVDLMGGTIEIETEQGAGTQFSVRLAFPTVDADDVPDAKDEPHEDVDFAGRCLLLVEDNEVNREIASMILAESGFELDTAQNGAEAVEMLVAAGPGRYDAVLMDVQMPVMDGYTATEKIRGLEDKELAATPIVAMTANAFAEDVRAALEAGMDAHIAKPLDVPKMLATLADVLQGR